MDIDIKAMQAEGQAKATAWLTQNLPAEQQGSPAPTQPSPEVPQQSPADPGTAKSQVAAQEAQRPGMAEAIRRDREARMAAQTAQTEAGKYKGELEALRRENEQLKLSSGTADPFEFLRSRKLTKEQQALWGQAFLYDLKPEVAPQEFRLDLYKAEQARQKELEAEEAARTRAEQERQAEQAHLQRYGNDLLSYVQSNPGSSPESEMWFTEEAPDGTTAVNHRVYAQSLLATADNLVRRAQATGQQADLSPANIARVLEAEVSKRLQRRDAKRAGSAQKPPQGTETQPGPNGKLADVTTTVSSAGLRGGPPQPPDMSEEARKSRAAAALFNTK